MFSRLIRVSIQLYGNTQKKRPKRESFSSILKQCAFILPILEKKITHCVSWNVQNNDKSHIETLFGNVQKFISDLNMLSINMQRHTLSLKLAQFKADLQKFNIFLQSTISKLTIPHKINETSFKTPSKKISKTSSSPTLQKRKKNPSKELHSQLLHKLLLNSIGNSNDEENIGSEDYDYGLWTEPELEKDDADSFFVSLNLEPPLKKRKIQQLNKEEELRSDSESEIKTLSRL